jgi:3-deoxy-manno-octulosonate cytidylyltransferase (CMP-KDO synthetase)
LPGGAVKAVILIPARFASTRYPGKPLVELRGAGGLPKPLIQRSHEAAMRVAGVSAVHVVTDDERIRDAAEGFGASVIMTSDACRNLQGDALLTPPGFVTALIDHMAANPDANVATPAMRQRVSEVRALQAEEAQGRVGGTSVVTDNDGRALYFSKRLIPYLPKHALDGELSPVRLHIGIYAYRRQALDTYVATPVSELEELEGLEQLRFLAAGIPVDVVEVETPPFILRELNNPEDVAPIEDALAAAGLE